MTDEQMKAIKSANNALKRLHKSGIMICAMDKSIYFATKERMNECKEAREKKEKERRGCSYCDVAETYALDEMNENVGYLYSDGFDDCGGW